MDLNPRSLKIVVDFSLRPGMGCGRTIKGHVDFVRGVIGEGMRIRDRRKSAGTEIDEWKGEKECCDDHQNE